MEVLIIKLGAKGDVVRTLSVLPAIKERYPRARITWITKKNISDLLVKNPFINEILTIPCEINKKFDILYNFDIEKEATYLAQSIRAEKKYGFNSEGQHIASFNLGAEYYLNTLYDDVLKKTNKKTYQEMMFELADLPFKKQQAKIYLDENDLRYGNEFVKKNNLLGKKIIGLHMGSSPRWPSKAWSRDKIKEFIRKAKSANYEIILFGGPDEVKSHDSLINELKMEKISIYHNSPENSNLEFASLLNSCDIVVCSDSFALHLAIALNKPTVALFFCTSPDEVEGYGLLKKVVSPMIYDFFPERQDEFSEELVNSISPEQVFSAISDLNEKD